MGSGLETSGHASAGEPNRPEPLGRSQTGSGTPEDVTVYGTRFVQRGAQRGGLRGVTTTPSSRLLSPRDRGAPTSRPIAVSVALIGSGHRGRFPTSRARPSRIKAVIMLTHNRIDLPFATVRPGRCAR
jgi:hypothetical protein